MYNLVSIAVLATRCLVELWCFWSVIRVLSLPFRLTNPFVVVWVFSLPVLLMRLFIGPMALVEGGYSNIYFQKAVLIEAISLLSGNMYLVLLLLFGQKIILKILPPVSPARYKIQTQRYSLLGVGFLALGFFSILWLASQKYGIANWILYPRTGYQYYRAAEGHWYTLAVNCMAVSAALILLFTRNLVSFVIGLFSLAVLVYLLGSKAFYLQFATFIVIALLFRRVRATIYLVPIIAVLSVFGMLQNFSQAGFSVTTKNVAQYFDYFQNSASIIRLIDLKILDFFYGEILSSSFWSSIPRGLVQSKPYVYGIFHLNEVLWPGLTKTGHTPAFTAGIDAYADFGWWGVTMQPFLGYGVPLQAVLYALAATVYRNFQKSGTTPLGVLAVVVSFAPGSLTFLGLPWNILWLGFVLTALMFSRTALSRPEL